MYEHNGAPHDAQAVALGVAVEGAIADRRLAKHVRKDEVGGNMFVTKKIGFVRHGKR